MNNINNDTLISETNIIDVNADTFMSHVIESSKKKPIIVDFWAPWCEPCKQLTPLIENAVKDKGEKLILAKIDIDQNQEIASQLRIQSIPTVYTFFGGKVVDGFQGVKTNSEILDFVEKSLSLSGPGEEVEKLLSISEKQIKERNWKESEEISQKILQLDPKSNIGFGNLIRSMIGLNKFSEVKDMIDDLPSEIKTSKAVSEALSSLDPSEKAFNAKENIQILERKLKQHPENLDYLLEMAIALFGNNNIESSFNMLLKSIEIDKEWKNQAAKKQLLEFFVSAGFDTTETINARRKLATILFS